MMTDVARVKDFYTALFNGTTQDTPTPFSTYTHFALDGDAVTRAFPIQPDMIDAKPHWDTYFTVRDTDVTTAVDTSLGGTICVPPQDIRVPVVWPAPVRPKA
jgi:predicted enzyme related to lactoylglutathione lyase